MLEDQLVEVLIVAVLDQFRRRKKQQSREANLYADETDERRTAPIDRCADPNGMALEKLWDNLEPTILGTVEDAS